MNDKKLIAAVVRIIVLAVVIDTVFNVGYTEGEKAAYRELLPDVA